MIGGPAPTKDESKPAAPEPEKVAEKLEKMNAKDAFAAPAPEPEPEEDIPPPADDEEDATFDGREHLNLVFIGHVDAGKSTIGGQILFQAGCVDDRTIEKYEKDAKEKNRESWYMAYIMDTNEEERAKGKTVEVGRAHFETEKKRYTVLDAPGHKELEAALLRARRRRTSACWRIAARKGEFETGFERGGQTREHAQLAKTLGVTKFIVVVNKMDDPTVHGIRAAGTRFRPRSPPFLKSCGYNPKDVQFVPISGLYGTNMKTLVTSTCARGTRASPSSTPSTGRASLRAQPGRAVPPSGCSTSSTRTWARSMGKDGGGHGATRG